MTRTLISATAYVDSQVPGDEGWVYRLVYADLTRDEDGYLFDDSTHEESGPMDAALGSGDEIAELRGMIAAAGGPEHASLVYSDGGEGSHRWRRD